jgi:hypothetical protein
MNDLQKKIQQELYDVYHGTSPVIKALEALVEAFEEFDENTEGARLVHLGIPHYKHVLKEFKQLRDEARKTAEGLGHVFYDG